MPAHSCRDVTDPSRRDRPTLPSDNTLEPLGQQRHLPGLVIGLKDKQTEQIQRVMLTSGDSKSWIHRLLPTATVQWMHPHTTGSASSPAWEDARLDPSSWQASTRLSLWVRGPLAATGPSQATLRTGSKKGSFPRSTAAPRVKASFLLHILCTWPLAWVRQCAFQIRVPN